MGLILSIDIGTTNVKAALVNEQGEIVGDTKNINMKMEGDASGRAEHDPAKLSAALFDVCKRAIGDKGRDIDALAMTSYMFGLLLADKDHNALTQISTFVDTTSQSHYGKFLEAIGDVDAMYLKTGCPPVFQFPVNRLYYLSAKQPALAAKAAYVLDSKAFLMHKLTGEYFTDYSTANSMGCLNTDGQWDEKIIDVCGFQPAQFPKVLNGFTESVPLTNAVCAEFGLKQGTVIFAGLYDGGALAAAVSGFEANVAVGNFGTSGMFRVPTDAPIEGLDLGIMHSCMVKPGLFFTGAGINNCTISTNLLLNLLGLELDYLSKKDLSIPGSNGVMTFPYFTGERDKIIGNIGTGMVFGLGVASTRDDMARSFLEGVAFSYRLIKDRLGAAGAVKEFRLGGGGTANVAWMQILSDTLNLPVRLTKNPEMGIIGAACLARHRELSALQENSRRIMQESLLIEPIAKNAQIYNDVAERYFAIRTSLREPLLARRGFSA